MAMHIAFVRGINVGGHHKIAMADLRKLLADLGFDRVTSLLQSGNLAFESGRQTGVRLERLLEKETETHLGMSVDYCVRSAAELGECIARNPFSKEARDDPSHLLAMFMKSAPSADNVAALQASIQGPELIACEGRQLYLVYPDGIGRSKVTGAVIERKLGLRGTARNWNTLQKLIAACK